MDIKLSDYTLYLNKKAMYMLPFSYFEVFLLNHSTLIHICIKLISEITLLTNVHAIYNARKKH